MMILLGMTSDVVLRRTSLILKTNGFPTVPSREEKFMAFGLVTQFAKNKLKPVEEVKLETRTCQGS
jgi:hypothetical protein